MTTTIILSGSNDGWVQAGAAVWDDALNGASPTAVNGGTSLPYGTEWIAGVFYARQAFAQFTYSRPTNETETAVTLGVQHAGHNTTAVSRELWVHAHSFGATVDTADWVNPLGMSVKTRLARWFDAQASGTSQYIWAGNDELTSLVKTTGSSTYQFVYTSHRQLIYGLNSGFPETSQFWSAESSLDPVMVVTTVPRSTLYEVLGAQVQLSDGTWVGLESDGAADPTIVVKHITTAGVATSKGNIANNGFSVNSVNTVVGAQQIAMAVDASDNLYLVGRQFGTPNNLYVQAWQKGAGYSWTPKTPLAATLPYSDIDPTNFAVAWHSVGGGTLVVVASRGATDGNHAASNEMCWAILSGAAALAGTGTLIRASATALGALVPILSPNHWMVGTNETGTGLDIAALDSTKGVVHTWSRRDRLGANQPTCKARYQLNSTGTGWTTFYEIPESSAATWGVKTASGKLRVVPINSDTFAAVTADPTSGYGLTVAILRNSGSTSLFTLLGRVLVGGEGLATMPSAATLAESQAWDVTYLAGPNKLWIYYFDTANNRRLMRTSVNLNTYVGGGDEVEVSAAVGAVGSTNLAIRAIRGTQTSRRNLLSIANRTSGGVLSTIYQVDTPNESPTAPTLTPRTGFDATQPATFYWTFNDPDIGDTQESFQVDINTSGGSDVYDSGRLRGSITYVGAGAKAEGDNASLVPAFPTVASGDCILIIASIRNSGVGTVNQPVGWESIVNYGNVRVLGRIYRTGDVAPTVTFSGGAAGDTTIAAAIAFRGTTQDITNLLLAPAATQLNASAQNIALPAYTAGSSSAALIAIGWKQDDGTLIATLASQSFTEAFDYPSSLGNDAYLEAQYRLSTNGFSADNFAVTGGAAAISRGIVFGIRPHPTPTVSSFTLPANILSNGNSYQWRVRTWDSSGAISTYSAYSAFTTGAGGTVTVTDPSTDNPAGIITSTYPVQWSLSGATQASYRVEVYRTDTSALTYTSGWVTSTATTHVIANMESDIEYRVEVTTRTGLLVESNVGTRLITPDYDLPDTPTVAAVLTQPDLGYTLISVTNPATSGSRPPVLYNQIMRRAVDGPEAGEDWISIGTVGLNGQWYDYTAASNVTYQYVARAVTAGEVTIDSAPVAGTLCLAGVWIHDPADPAGTVSYWLYGTGRGDEFESIAEGLYYAGRTFPVFDFGEHEAETLTVPIQVPRNDEHLFRTSEMRRMATSKTTLCIRDARSRRIFGVVTKVSRSDEKGSTNLNLTVTRVDYDESHTEAP